MLDSPSSETEGDAAFFALRANVLLVLERNEEALLEARRSLEILPEKAEYHLLRGKALHRLGRHSASNLSLETALALNPQLVEALYLEGVNFKLTGKYAEAEQRFRRLLASDPDHAGARIALIELRYAKAISGAEREGLIAELERVLEKEPAHAAGNLLLVRMTLDTGRFGEAMAVARDWKGKYGDSVDMELLEAEALSASGSAVQAVALLEGSSMKDRRLKLYLARLYGTTGRIRKALSLLETVVADSEEDDAVLVERIRLALSEGAVARARGLIGDLGEASQGEASYLLASAFFKSHRFRWAKRELASALRIAPNLIGNRMLNARLLLELGLPGDGLAFLDEGAPPSVPVVSELYGDLYWRLGEPEAASVRYAEALARRPSPRVEIKLAGVERALGMKAQAEARLEKLETFFPENYHVLMSQAVRASDSETTLEKLEKARKLREEDGAGHLLLAEVLIERGEFAEASSVLEEGLDRFPYRRDLLEKGAELWERTGNRAKAIEAWTMVIESGEGNGAEPYLRLHRLYDLDDNEESASRYRKRYFENVLNP